MNNKPISESCIQNQDVILNELKKLFKPNHDIAKHIGLDRDSNNKDKQYTVLEIGSGTGQHAVYFAQHMPYLSWQTSDCHEYHDGIIKWIGDAQLNNIHLPLELDVSHSAWPVEQFDAIFSANTCHIMSWKNVQDFFLLAGEKIKTAGLLVIYGPFNYAGQYTSTSNQLFDQWLISRDPLSAIRDFEAINDLARSNGLELQHDIEMPVNNRLLCWQKSGEKANPEFK